jgi:DNA-binding FrmR family transcriptional regulator
MGHVIRKADKLGLRLRRIRGQLDAAGRAIETEAACATVLQTLVACRGALNGLIAEVIEDHVRHHVVDPDKHSRSPQAKATRELLDVLRTYLR